MLEIVRLDDTEADWDSLVFSVQWPITTCNTWKERKPTHTCILPTDKISNDEQHWPVHGVWSIRTGSFEGPFFFFLMQISLKIKLNKISDIP